MRTLRIAVPLIEQRLSGHFGHSTHVMLLDADEGQRRVFSSTLLALPPHEPGALPRFLVEHRPDVLLVGGIGQRAVYMLAEAGCRVVAGAPAGAEPVSAVTDYLHWRLRVSDNGCGGHGEGHACGHSHPHEPALPGQ